MCELDWRAQKKGIHYVRFLSNEQYHSLDLPPVSVLASDHCFISWGKQTIPLRKLSETDFKSLIFFLIRRGSGTMGKHISYWHIICLFPGDVKCYGTWFYSQGFKLLCSLWIRSFSLCFLDAFTAFLVLYIFFIIDFFSILWVSAPVYLLSLFWVLIVLWFFYCSIFESLGVATFQFLRVCGIFCSGLHRIYSINILLWRFLVLWPSRWFAGNLWCVTCSGADSILD